MAGRQGEPDSEYSRNGPSRPLSGRIRPLSGCPQFRRNSGVITTLGMAFLNPFPIISILGVKCLLPGRPMISTSSSCDPARKASITGIPKTRTETVPVEKHRSIYVVVCSGIDHIATDPHASRDQRLQELWMIMHRCQNI